MGRPALQGLAAALVATITAQVLATLAVFVLPTLAPEVARHLGVSPRLVGYQVAVVYSAASVASLTAGAVLARIGPARCTQFALLSVAMGAGLIALAGLPGAVLGSAALGLGYGLTNPAATQVLNRLSPAGRRNLVFAIKQTGVPVGGALAGLVLPALALWLGWRGAAMLVAGAALAAAVALWPFRQAWDAERPASGARGGGSGFALLRSVPGLGALAAMGSLFSAVQLSLGAYAVTMLVEEFGWSVVAAGAASAASLVAGAVARLGWAAAADRTGQGFPVLAVIGLGTAAGALALPFAADWPAPAVVGVLCLFGACAAGWTGVAMAEGARLAPPGAAGAATGAVLAVTFIGVVVGPSILAAVVARIGSYAEAFALMSLVPLTGSLIAWRAHRRLRGGS